jgi:lipopolysaccharide/colanic/teichoic acid biosynthesis glycosyltransferase
MPRNSPRTGMKSNHHVPADSRDPFLTGNGLGKVVPDGPSGPHWFKVVFDCIFAALLLPVAIPLIGFAALAVKLTSSGPAFYTQTRTGLNGRRFRIIKIRTMHQNCEARSGIRWASKGDSRVTHVGRFLRVTHLDELPQLWNVFRGEMSIIGPRPERPEVIAALNLDGEVPGYASRLRVKPGVTGLAQVQLPADSDLKSVRRKVAYDQYYIQNWSVWLDLRVLAATLFKAVGAGRRFIRWACYLPDGRVVARTCRSALTRSPGRLSVIPSPPAIPPLEGPTPALAK